MLLETVSGLMVYVCWENEEAKRVVEMARIVDAFILMVVLVVLRVLVYYLCVVLRYRQSASSNSQQTHSGILQRDWKRGHAVRDSHSLLAKLTDRDY